MGWAEHLAEAARRLERAKYVFEQLMRDAGFTASALGLAGPAARSQGFLQPPTFGRDER